MKPNIKNERIKRRFFRWLKEANGCCEATAGNVEKALSLYEDFTGYADFASYNPNTAIEFKKRLKERKYRGKTISLTTYHGYLKNIKKFFLWLSWQDGYKSKIKPDMVDYLNISDKEERIARQTKPINYPSLDYVIKLTDSIAVNTEVDSRDRALISFTLLSGMRVKSIATLPLGCFDEETQTINQDPRLGVQTKFSKCNRSVLFNFDDKLVKHVTGWISYIKARGFGSRDPLFPRSKIRQEENGLSFEDSLEIEPVYWQGTGSIRKIFKKRSREAGLPYFSPHTFRHLAVDLAIQNCRTGEQIKAVSQNFGHEYIATTFSSYGNYDQNRLTGIIKKMDFSGKPSMPEAQKLELIRNIANS
ncbi:MAG: site-specific integrase [Deltaproteobacteria bacterium]|uniref:Site-specific integrase n=1 Tax=Candidatus Zymogenus saltonus TaxID=2844893 RepID=A0A9D8KJG7_9DELT|nr:site-specific integrase [Candidatus Zymogenus saltonus]